MAETSKIEWTDATWNPITGCTLVSEGCRHCYAATLAATRLKNHPSRAGLARLNARGEAKFTGEVRLNAQWLDQPLRWRRPRMIFVCAHGDLFHEGVPDEWIDRVFAVMALAPWHTFQVLTKRPERARAYLSADWEARVRVEVENLTLPVLSSGASRAQGTLRRYTAPAFPAPLPNVWLGTSVEDQAAANARIPHLLEAPAAKRFLSAEPLLGPLELLHIRWTESEVSYRVNALGHYPISGSAGWWSGTGDPHELPRGRLSWVIVGGESGPGARPMHPDWARSLRDQCAAAGVPFFFKQWGEWHTHSVLMTTGLPIFRQFHTYQDWVNKAPSRVQGGQCYDAAGNRLKIGADFMRARDEGLFPVTIMNRVGKSRAGRLLDGVEHNGMPEARP